MEHEFIDDQLDLARKALSAAMPMSDEQWGGI